MKTFHCTHCQSLVFFENVTCLTCGNALAYLPDPQSIVALRQATDGSWKATTASHDDPSMRAPPDPLHTRHERFDQMVDAWLPLTYILNNLNRGLGLPDSYPFVLSAAVIAKLRFIHQVVTERTS